MISISLRNWVSNYFLMSVLFMLSIGQSHSVYAMATIPEVPQDVIQKEYYELINNPYGVDSIMGLFEVHAGCLPVLNGLVKELAQQVGIPMPTILVYKGTIFSFLGNFTGLDYRCRNTLISIIPHLSLICIGDDLLKTLTLDELRAALAHELIYSAQWYPLKVLGTHVATKFFNQYISLRYHGMCLTYLIAFFWRAAYKRAAIYKSDAEVLTLTQNPVAHISMINKVYNLYVQKHYMYSLLKRVREFLGSFFKLLSYPTAHERIRALYRQEYSPTRA